MKRIGWKLEFISGGYGYTMEELNETIEMVSYVQNSKQYLNVGIVITSYSIHYTKLYDSM